MLNRESYKGEGTTTIVLCVTARHRPNLYINYLYTYRERADQGAREWGAYPVRVQFQFNPIAPWPVPMAVVMGIECSMLANTLPRTSLRSVMRNLASQCAG